MGQFDEAYEFIHSVEDNEKEAEPVDIKKVYRKIDKRVLPILAGIYFLQFLDKTLINYAGVMGIKDHLDDSNQFGDLATILYAGYIIFEPFIAFGFQKLPFAKLFGTSIVLWGVVVTLHVVCLNYSSLMAVRFFLGGLESSAATGILIANGMWYRHRQQSGRFAIITSQVGLATILGGLLSFAFQHVDKETSSLEGWQIYFLLMGLITVAFGAVVLMVLPDNPMSCKFLNRDEKLALLEYLRDNQTGIENKTFKMSQLKDYLKDPHTWLLHLLTIVSMIPTGAIITFSVSIIGSFGFTAKEASLMQMPVGLSSIIAILVPMYIISYCKGNYRTILFIGLLLIAIVGYFILIFSTNRYANLFGVYFGNAGTCVITLIYSWNNRNTSGYSKRLIRNCFTMISIAVGCLIAGQVFKNGYLTAKIILLSITAASIVLVAILGYVSRAQNLKREGFTEERHQEFYKQFGDDFEYKDLTDVQNIHFRYGY